ncbi:hypothetical protein [Streptomyces sp. NPDC056227]|uniref:hypothetical protein n=1 Tax=Streptomyces sp. NPDC056227 TaxID=3345753 RepID=UPI0035D81B89
MSDPLLSVGLARWHTGIGIHHLQRLRRILDGLGFREDVSRVHLALYGALGFSPELHAAHTRGEVMSVDLERLYRGAWRTPLRDDFALR